MAEHLLDNRQRDGWSYDEVARLLRASMRASGDGQVGLDGNSVRRWESGERWPEPRFRQHLVLVFAEHLGTAPSSLYRHVASREEVLVLIVDAVLGGFVTTEAPGGDWQATLRSSAHSFRRHLLAHRNIVPLIAEAQMLGPNAMHHRESALRALIGAGFDPAIAVRCYLAIVHFTIANVQLSFREAASPRGRRSPLRQLFANQDPDALPTVVRHADVLAEHNSDAEFDFGLEALLDGTGELALADDAGVRGEASA